MRQTRTRSTVSARGFGAHVAGRERDVKSRQSTRALAIALAVSALPCCGALPLKLIELPPGFEISIYAEHVAGARGLALGERGTLFVGTYKEGKVYAVPLHESGEKARPITLARKLQDPTGVAFRDGALYVAEQTRILRFDDIEDRLSDPPAPLVVLEGLPRQREHGLRTIHFGPDGLLYIAVGAPCNVCVPEAQYAQIARADLASWPLHKELFAQGVRNSLGFDWDPRTGELWFTDNGRERLGEDPPSDELDHAPAAGMHFGFPYCHAGELPDTELGQQRDCSEFVPPALQLAPQATPLGMRFYDAEQFPAEYRNAIFIAEHGSLNSRTKAGFRIAVVTLEGNRAVRYETFAKGWLQRGRPWGRPADVIVAPDGALLVSDDKAGVVYRIAFRPE